MNCVWDLYRDEMEEYVMKRREADYALKMDISLEGARRKRRRREDTGMSGSSGRRLVYEEAEGAVKIMDDDGGGSERLRSKSSDSDLSEEDMFKNIPVGIREFMKQEKRLKEKHAREGTTGA